MLASEWIRRTAFWAVDCLRGSRVRRHYLDIRNIMENSSGAQAAQFRGEHLNRILNYAVENVPFYRRFKGFASLASFPVIDKVLIKASYADFQSQEFKDAKLIRLHSSGSTGRPFFISQDRDKRNRVYAEMMYFWGKAGYRLGMRYVFFRFWSEDNRKSWLSAWARNLIMWDIQRLDEENLQNIRNLLKTDGKLRMLIGYASTLDVLAEYLLENGVPTNRIELILSGAEMLTENTRAKVEKVFGCPVVSVYSNQENGLLAIECSGHGEFHVNTASYYIELLKLDKDEPAAAGEPGRIVVTDFFNHAIPLIRYDTGDIAAWKPGADCGWDTPAFSAIQGRVVDVIRDTCGNWLSPFTVGFTLWPYDKIAQFQFIQEDEKRYRLKLVGAREHYDDTVFVDEFKKRLGEDAEIIVEHVNEIPLSPSGKRRVVVSMLPESKT